MFGIKVSLYLNYPSFINVFLKIPENALYLKFCCIEFFCNSRTHVHSIANSQCVLSLLLSVIFALPFFYRKSILLQEYRKRRMRMVFIFVTAIFKYNCMVYFIAKFVAIVYDYIKQIFLFCGKNKDLTHSGYVILSAPVPMLIKLDWDLYS